MANTENEIKALKRRAADLLKKVKELQSAKNNDLLKSSFTEILRMLQKTDDIFYMRSMGLLFLLKRDAVFEHYDFIKGYVFDYLNRRGDWNLGILPRDCVLYEKHKDVFADNNILVLKYIARNGLVNKSVVSTDWKGQIFMESSYLGRENYQNDDNGLVYADQPKRAIIDGISVRDYMYGKSYEERMLIYHNVYNHLFTKYAGSDYTKVSGELLDAHMDNVIVNNQGFHFIDKDIIYDGELDKSMVLYRQFGDSAEYKYFIRYYNLPDMSAEYKEKYPLEHRNTEAMQQARELNGYLFGLYFSGRGLLSVANYSKGYTQKEQELYLEEQEFIDPAWYEQQYPNFRDDVLHEWEKNAVQHYMKYGWKKGYNPSPDFDTEAYLAHYANVKKENMNPLYHYVKHGKKEGRAIFKVAALQDNQEQMVVESVSEDVVTNNEQE